MVNPWLVALITTGTGAMILVAVRKAIQAQRAPAASDVPRRLVGLSGPVKTDLNPIGTAQIGSELWSAVAAGGEPIRAGEVVEVVAVDGLTLRVRRVEIPSHSSSGGSHV
jgi:membrane-bound serine protease (ClpP class)